MFARSSIDPGETWCGDRIAIDPWLVAAASSSINSGVPGSALKWCVFAYGGAGFASQPQGDCWASQKLTPNTPPSSYLGQQDLGFYCPPQSRNDLVAHASWLFGDGMVETGSATDRSPLHL